MTANRIAPAQTSPLAMPASISGYLQQALGTLDLELATASADQAWSAAQRGLQLETAGKILAGRALIHLRDALEKREFSAGLADRGIARSTAYDSIEVYNLFAALPDGASVRALGQIGATKVMAFRQWAHGDLAALANGEEVHGLTLDQVAELSAREVQALVKQAQAQDAAIGRLESEKARLETELNKHRQQARAQAALRASEDLPMFAREPREEALVASESMMQSLELVDDSVLRNLLAEVDHPESLRWQPAAARTVAYALAPVAMRIGRLIKELRERFGDSVIGPLDADSFLEPSEALQLMMGRQQLIKQAMELAQGRDDARANTTPGKRGRKRGSPGKQQDASA